MGDERLKNVSLIGKFNGKKDKANQMFNIIGITSDNKKTHLLRTAEVRKL